nr:hypothetical protein [Nitrospira sp.]
MGSLHVLAEPEAEVFMESGILKRLLDETVAHTMTQTLVSPRTTLNGTLVPANASPQSFVPRAVFLNPEEYKSWLRSLEAGPDSDQASGTPTV